MMEAVSLYLIKSVLWLTGFALVYKLFLQNERFFSLNRLFLLSGIIVSFVFPFITIHYQVEIPAISNTGTGTISTGREGLIANPEGFLSGTSMQMKVVFILYLSGVLFFIYMMIRHLLSLSAAIRRASVNYSGRAKLIRISGFPSSFSFFNYVFIDPAVEDDEAREIMNHELVHVHQKHWLDLLLSEILRIVQWINPFAWIYSGFIRQNHEYLADEKALLVSANPATYRATLINQLFSSKVISLTNSFNYSLNKKRFHMMKKIVTSPFRKLKVLLILPVFAIILYSFSKPEYRYISVNAKEGVNAPMTVIQSEGTKVTDFRTAEIPAEGNTVSMREAVQSKGAKAEIATPASDTPEEEVKGTIVQTEGKPLGGAIIVIKGTTIGTTSDDRGFFRLSGVSGDALLVVSYVGYKSKVLKPVFDSEMKIVMVQDTIKLENYDGSIPLPPPPPPPPPPSSGKSTGNMPPAVRQSSDAAIPPLKDTGIKIRSNSDPMKNPLIVVDGVIKDISVNSISPEVIQSISVLKNESATKLYGAKGKDEVIIITTKAGYASTSDKSGDKSEVMVTGYASEQEKKDEAFVVVEELPEFPGGGADAMRSWLAHNIQYPEEAVKTKITGIVNVVFVVDKTGKIKNVKVVKSLHPLLDEEAVRVVRSMPDWKPGKQAGKPVDVQMTVPLTFSLK